MERAVLLVLMVGGALLVPHDVDPVGLHAPAVSRTEEERPVLPDVVPNSHLRRVYTVSKCYTKSYLY